MPEKKHNSCLTGTCEGRVMYQILLAPISACSVSDRHPSIDHRCIMHAYNISFILTWSMKHDCQFATVATVVEQEFANAQSRMGSGMNRD